MLLQHSSAPMRARQQATNLSTCSRRPIAPVCRSQPLPLRQQHHHHPWQRWTALPAATSSLRPPPPPAAAAAAASGRPQRQHRVSVSAMAASSEGFNPMKTFQKELGIQSNKLQPDIKERVERAIAALGYRVTVGDVAARAGVSIAQADEALKALAYDALGNLEVSNEGEVCYVFDPGFMGKIRNRSWVQRLLPWWNRARSAALYATRIAFGTALVVSVVLVWLAVAVLASSGRDNDNRRSGGSYGGGYYGGGGFISPVDIWILLDPGYGPYERRRRREEGGMNFLEAIFSFVFGDGDPNETFEERRWRALGQHIQTLGGVVSAEEIAPFLDPPPLGRRRRAGPNKYEDESFVLPALIRFRGEPFVDDNGGLLYKFPELQVGAAPVDVRLQRREVRVPIENNWEFSAASAGQQAGALLLGAVNVIGVLTLTTMLGDPYSKLALVREGFGFLLNLLPALQLYAAGFFTIPLLRAFVLSQRNAEVDARNSGRLEAVDLLQSQDPDLVAKSAAARKLGGRKVIGATDVVYTTERSTGDQVEEMEADEFDRKLGVQPARRRGSSPSDQPRQLSDSSSAGRRIDDVFGRMQQQQQRERELQFERRRQQGGSSRRERQRQINVDWEESASRSSGSGSRRRDSDWDRLDRW